MNPMSRSLAMRRWVEQSLVCRVVHDSLPIEHAGDNRVGEEPATTDNGLTISGASVAHVWPTGALYSRGTIETASIAGSQGSTPEAVRMSGAVAVSRER